MNGNSLDKAIKTLVMNGYDILDVVFHDGHHMLFSVYKWQEAYFNTAQSIEYHTVEGIDVTEFIQKNAETCTNYKEFISRFEREIEQGMVVRCEFSKNAIFYKWSQPATTNRR